MLFCRVSSVSSVYKLFCLPKQFFIYFFFGHSVPFFSEKNPRNKKINWCGLMKDYKFTRVLVRFSQIYKEFKKTQMNQSSNCKKLEGEGGEGRVR